MIWGLEYLAEIRPEVFWMLMSHTDMGQMSEVTGDLPLAVGENVRTLMWIANYDDTNTAVQRLMAMPFLKSMERSDDITLSLFEKLLQDDPYEAERILTHLTSNGGVLDGDPLSGVILYLDGRDPELAAKMAGLSWIEDGIDESEYLAALNIQDLALKSLPLLRALMEKPWILDGLDRVEGSIIYHLTLMSEGQWYGTPPRLKSLESEALRIIQMPFLNTVELSDRLAVYVLGEFSDEEGLLDQILSTPELNGGITDTQVPIISAMRIFLLSEANRNTNHFAPLLRNLLNSRKTIVEERDIILPLAGDMLLTVVRTGSGGPSAMDSLEKAVRSHEEFMNVPLPVPHVHLLITERGLSGRGSPVGVLYVDAATFPDPHETIAHEAAHLYWVFSPYWLAEGGAVFLERMSQNKLTYGFDFRIGVDACDSGGGHKRFIDNLTELSRQPLAICHYSMGSGLLYALYHELGEETFRRGFKDLYLNVDAEQLPGIEYNPDHKILVEKSWYDGIKYDDCSRLIYSQWALCHMKAAFVANTGPESARKVDAILHQWFFAHPESQAE